VYPLTNAALRFSLGFVVIVACGGKSVRYDDDSSSGGEPVEPPRGGYPSFGGTTGPGTGGTGTSGTFDGGGVSFGGSMPVGGTSVGGTSVGGTGIGGTGTGGTGVAGVGAAGQGGAVTTCSDVPGLPPRDAPIGWERDGVVEWFNNAFGIQGSWYTVDDCISAPSGWPCTRRNQNFLGPDGQFGWFATTNEVGASGTAPRVLPGPDGAPAYALQWGFLTGMPLNGESSWDAMANCASGFQLDIEGTAPITVRVLLPMPSTQDTQHFVEVARPAKDLLLHFSAFAQGSWVTNPRPLDVSDLMGLQFQVVTNEVAPTPFDFCVKNIRVIPKTLR
jgi:hypothetical protein